MMRLRNRVPRGGFLAYLHGMASTSLDQVINLLATSPLLNLFPEREIADLARQARVRHFETGESVFTKGDPGDSVYWVRVGRLKLTVTGPGGSELLHSMIEAGDYCGEITTVDGGVRGVNAIADRSTETVSINREILLPTFERNPKAALNLARLLCKQIRIASATLENLAFHNAETRIWTRLNYLSKQYGEIEAKTQSLRINHRLSQQSLADSVGLTRVMVNRQLSVWRDEGWIEVGRGFVLIADPPAFEAHVWNSHVPQ